MTGWVRATMIGLLTGCGDGSTGGDGTTDEGSTGGPSSSGATMSSSNGVTSNEPSTSSNATSSSTVDASSSDESSGGSGSSTTGPEGTAGCGLANEAAVAEWVGYELDVDGTTRQYWIWLPDPYDPNRPYPIVYQFHGCSSSEDRQNNNPPVEQQSGAEAIHVRGRAISDCWDLTPEGPDVFLFDALVERMEASFCADPARRFVTGYSSGAFMTHRVACDRGDMLRGVASIAGGVGGTCQGSVAALLIHDLDDSTVNISASEDARDTHLARNGCDAAMPTTPVDPAPCEAYAGCNEGYPVVWCQTAGQDHSRQDELSAPAFWNFLSALPSE